MTRDEIVLLAREALKHDPGYAAWTLSTPHLEMIVNNAIKAEREKVAAWMIERDYATGHGDTIEGLLKALEWQAKERVRGFL